MKPRTAPIRAKLSGAELREKAIRRRAEKAAKGKVPKSRIGLLMFCDIHGIRKRPKKKAGVYGAYHKWIKTKACVLANHPLHECGGPVTGHHIRHVNNGGKDAGNEIPLCESAHTSGPHAIHGPNSGKRTFEKYWEINLTELAAHYEALYETEIE